MNARAFLLERALVALATIVFVWFCFGALRELQAGVSVPSLTMPAMMLIYSFLLLTHSLRERELRKTIKAAGGSVGRWEKAAYTVLAAGAVAFAVATQGSVVAVAACIGVVAVGFLFFGYRDLQRLQAEGHFQ